MKNYVLSNAQKRIWYAQKKYRESSLFNIGGTVRIKGNIQVDVLKEAILQVIKNNEALKLQFQEKADVTQYCNDKECFVDYIDFSKELNPKESYNIWCDKQAQIPFNMIDNNLYYIAVFKISDYDMGYLLKMHHIIADGWSMKLITDQISNEYERLIDDNKITDSKKFYSYLDYLLEEQKYLTSSIDKDKKYWREMFTPLPDRTTISSEQLKGQRSSFIVEEEMYTKIEDFINEKGISLNIFFVFIYLVYEYKKKGNKDIIIGTPLLGRSGKKERLTVGNFTNTMPFRYIVNENNTVIDMLTEVSDNLKLTYIHQKFPYNILADSLELNKNGINRLYDVCINYYNTSLSTSINSIPVDNREFYNGQQEYALQIIIRHWNNIKLQLDYDFQTDVFSSKQIEDINKQLISLINQVLVNDNISIKDLSLLTDEDKKKFLDDYNNTKKEYPLDKTWLDLFQDMVRKHPHRVAASYKSEAITYKELYNKANNTASHLISKGVQKGDIIVVKPNYNIESIITIIAVMKSGGVYLPVDAGTPIDRINEIINNSGAHYIIADEKGDYNCSFLNMKELTEDECNQENVDCITSSDIAYMIYTSGSTGTPKGVMISNKNLMNYLCWAKEMYLKKDNEVFALYSSFAFDFTMTSIFLPLISGNEIRVYNNNCNINIFNEILTDNKVTIIKITPSHISLISDVSVENSLIHTFIVGGENLKTEVCNNLYRQFNESVNIYNEYGPTEATIGCMIYLYHKDKYESVPIGIPISNTQIYLLDKDLQPVPKETYGEIYIGGESVSLGYYNNEKETNERFINNPFINGSFIYKTGDIGYFTGDGNIIFNSRCDNEVKLRGNRVSLSEIEYKILESDQVIEAIVKVIDNEKIKQLCAYIIGKPNYNKNKLREYLLKHLPGYMVPEYYVKLDKFPLTVNGKLDAKRLPSPFIYPNAHRELKLTKELELLKDVIENVLHKKDIYEDDDFYVLGGDSIKAIQISSRLYDKGYELSVRNILENPLLNKMVDSIKPRTISKYEQGICSGYIKKTSITEWFFGQRFKKEGHYNQSVLLELKENIPLDSLNKVFVEIIKHHDALRLNYDRKTEQLFYNNKHLNKNSIVDLINVEENNSEEFLIDLYRYVNMTFDLENALLVRPYLIVTEEKNYLFIMVHHLVTDGVSWTIILEDLVTLLTQINNNEDLKLPLKTASYVEFSEGYEKLVKNHVIDYSYWNDIIREDNGLVVNKESSIYEHCKTIEVKLDEENTEMLLGKANVSYNTKPIELMLIALVRGIKQIVDSNKILINVESHGRGILDDINTNRTIGWFTNMYPIQLVFKSDDLNEQIKSMKEQIRLSSGKGYEYGILKCKNNDYIKDEVGINFNYLGEYIEVSDKYYSLKKVLFDSDINSQNKMPFLIDINALIINKKFEVFIRYAENVIERESIINLSDNFIKELITIISHCSSLNERYYTPIDFCLANLTQEELDKLLI